MNVAAERLGLLPPYLFAELDRKKSEIEKSGRRVISFTIGDPDLPTPEPIIRACQRALERPENHRYPDYAGSRSFRKAAARWMKRRFGIELDPDGQVAALIGSKEGIAHTAWACVNPGDVVLCPDPAYPVYANSALLSGGEVVRLPLRQQRGFLPDLGAIDGDTAARARLLWLNYPNNPTGAVASLDFWKEAVEFCRSNDILLCSDAAYSEMNLGGEPPPSVLQVEGALDVAVEFHSLSKTFNMTGWRVGFVAGNADAIAAIVKIKTNVDSGVFGAIQQAAEAALEGWPALVEPARKVYRKRAEMLVGGLRRLGIEAEPPAATFYLWIRAAGGDDMKCAADWLERAAVMVTPGSGFGEAGRGYLRLCLTTSEADIEEAIDRLSKVLC